MAQDRDDGDDRYGVEPVTGGTSHRLEWRFLPRHLRKVIEGHCGSPVRAATSSDRGFTPGFASVLECEDGSRHFVKAASVRAQGVFAAAYREEARKLAAIPSTVPAPALRWVHDDDWVALGIDHVDGRHPARPWSRPDLEACLDSLERVAEVLTPVPDALDLADAEPEFAPFLDHWAALRDADPADLPHLPGLERHLPEALELASGYVEPMRGDTVVHVDVRDDNVLLDHDGTAWFCDWNWPVRGAPWLDSLFMLIGPRGDGVDCEEVLTRRRLLQEVPAGDVDVVLALVTGYFLDSARQPAPPTSPLLRRHQQWQGEVCWRWLCERRGW